MAGVAPASAALATHQRPEDAARQMEFILLLFLLAPLKPKHKRWCNNEQWATSSSFEIRTWSQRGKATAREPRGRGSTEAAEVRHPDMRKQAASLSRTHRPPKQQQTMRMTMSHVERLRTCSHRGRATAREPRGKGSTEAAEVRHLQTRSKPVSYTQAAEATTNHEDDNDEWASTSNRLDHEDEANEGRQRHANPEAGAMVWR